VGGDKMTHDNVKFLDKLHDPNFIFELPWFYNNKYALRCELGIGTDDKEYMDNAYKRAVEIFNIVFDKKPDLYFFDACIYDYSCVSAMGFKTNIGVMVRAYKEELKDLAFLQRNCREMVKVNITLDDIEEDMMGRNRFFVYTDKKKIDFDKILKWEVTNAWHYVHFVSLDDECIFSIYDDRGLDIVFTSKEKGKPFYEKLKPYLLEYDIERMKKTFE
jgi:hypothetical protein